MRQKWPFLENYAQNLPSKQPFNYDTYTHYRLGLAFI